MSSSRGDRSKVDPGPGDRARRLVLVLGMHRSGTSAITRGLKVLGVELGDNMWAADPEVNAKGYWEDVDLASLNIRLLEALGSEWHDPRPLSPDFVERLISSGFLEQAVDLLRAKLEAHRVFGFKDPRNSLLLPFWKRAFAELQLRVGYVLAVRNPLSVVASLARRDRFSFEKSALLWLTHCVGMMESTSSDPERVIVDYDTLMQAPAETLRRVGSSLGLDVILSELEDYERTFLDQGLRHSEHDPNDPALSLFMGTLLRDFYGVLREAAQGLVPLDSERVLSSLKRARRELDSFQSSIALAG